MEIDNFSLPTSFASGSVLNLTLDYIINYIHSTIVGRITLMVINSKITVFMANKS